MTSALRLRIPGIVEDAQTVDVLPITLMSQTESDLDALSLICISEASDCGGCRSAPTCEHNDVMIKESNSFHSPGNASDPDKPADEMDEAPILSADHTGHSLKSLPTGYAIHFLGLNQAQ